MRDCLYLPLEMMGLKIISLFLFLLLAVQMLPLQQVGGMLSQNQWMEELPHNALDDTPRVNDQNSSHPFLPPSDFSVSFSLPFETKAIAYIHSSERIPWNHSTEIVIPPPDTDS